MTKRWQRPFVSGRDKLTGFQTGMLPKTPSCLHGGFLCSCFLLFPLPSPVGCVWGWQPGGATIQHPSLRTLQQGVEQQQLQWIRDQLRVWLRERKQLQREWRQQALALLQPRGKGFCSLWFRATICYYTHSDLFSSQANTRKLWGDAQKYGRARPRGYSSWHAVKCKCLGILGRLKHLK